MISTVQQRIYNSYLYAVRTCNDKPFKARKDFKDVTEEHKIQLLKLDNMFKQYPSIGMDVFFKAPFEQEPDIGFLELQFYNTYKAKSYYSKYIKKLQNSADFKTQKEYCKKSAKFIFSFCQDNGITLDEYKTLKSGEILEALIHLHANNINFYIIHALHINISTVPSDLVELMFGDGFYTQYKSSYNMYVRSPELKKYIDNLLEIVGKTLLINEK